jgi:Mrp family chromosome partitioning ATPase
MRTFLVETAKRFDMVILDCAPVTSVADALVLGSMVDGVVEVVKSHSTARGLLEQSTQHLRDVNAKVIGIILNQVDFRKTGYAYGKYYSYRYYGYYDYSYYASEDEPKLQGGKRTPRPHRRSAPPPTEGDDVKG